MSHLTAWLTDGPCPGCGTGLVCTDGERESRRTAVANAHLCAPVLLIIPSAVTWR